MTDRRGPLNGLRIIEIPNIGPLQHAGMIFADLGAEVLRLDRKAHVESGSGIQGPYSEWSILDRGRRSAGIDLKAAGAAEVVGRLAERADVLVEGFRPGVAERLGFGPEPLRARNPRLVYGRMTGWGQEGPLAGDVGHDINYISLAGALAHIGAAGGPPIPPLNLVGDFGGGSMLLVIGVLAALVERSISGEGQVVDAAMIDGTALLMSIFVAIEQMGAWGPRGTNMLDGGAHFYGAYECSDGEFVSLAAFEPQFYANFVQRIGALDIDGLRAADLPLESQMDKSRWPELRQRLGSMFLTKTRSEWVSFFEGLEICFAPVLSMREARDHPHHQARGTFIEIDGVAQPAPAPRFDRTPGAVPNRARPAGADTMTALTEWGFETAEVDALLRAGVVA